MVTSPNTISIIVPVFNVEQHLERCIYSILGQTHKNIEVILVNDGSTDKSPEICDRFANLDDRVIVIHKENGGASSARNTGINKAIGSYVLFVDSDDWIANTLLSDCLYAIENAEADMVIFGMFYDIEREGLIVESTRNHCRPMVFAVEDFYKHYEELYKHNCIISMCNRLLRSSLIHEYQLRFDNRVTNYEDMLFGLQYIAKCRRVVIVDGCYYHYVNRAEMGMSRKYKPGLSQRIGLTAHELRKAILNLSMNESTKAWAFARMQNILWVGVANICRGPFGLLRKRKEIAALCSEKWVGEELSMETTGSKYNDLSACFVRNGMWLLLTLLNVAVIHLCEKRY